MRNCVPHRFPYTLSLSRSLSLSPSRPHCLSAFPQSLLSPAFAKQTSTFLPLSLTHSLTDSLSPSPSLFLSVNRELSPSLTATHPTKGWVCRRQLHAFPFPCFPRETHSKTSRPRATLYDAAENGERFPEGNPSSFRLGLQTSEEPWRRPIGARGFGDAGRATRN